MFKYQVPMTAYSKYLVVRDVRTSVLFDDERYNRDAFERAGGQARLPQNLSRFLVAQLKRMC